MGAPRGNGNGCWFERRISPLQLAVYWRLCVIIFFNSFLFFLDIYTVCSVRPPHNRTEHRVGPEAGVLNGSMWRDDSDSECVCLSYGQTLYLIGLLLGSLFGGALSDRYGRCAVLQVCVCVHAVCGMVPAAFHHPLVFIALRCLTGVCSSCMHICSFSLGVEWSVLRWRAWAPALLGFSFSLGMVVQAPLAYTFPSWTQLHLALGLPQILCLPIVISLPESPRWLLKRRTDILDQYCKRDQHYMDQLFEESTGNEVKQVTEAGPHSPPELGLCDLTHLRHPTILLRLTVMSYLGLTTALTYYGISLNIGSFGVNVYRAQFFSGLSETPCLFLPLLLAHCGRRTMSMLTMFLSGSACLLSTVASQIYGDVVWGMSLALLAKFCMLINMFVSLLFSIELFPTIARAGSIFNALVSISSGIPLAAMIVYGCGPIIGSLLCLLLPETGRGPLPDTLEDCVRQSKVVPVAAAGEDTKQVQTHLDLRVALL